MDTNSALVIGNFLLVAVTLVLVIVTISYAKSTKRMSDIMTADYEYRVTPFLEIEIRGASSIEAGKVYDIALTNRGALAFKVTEISLMWKFHDSEKFEEIKSNFDEQYLYPDNNELKHNLRCIKRDFAKYNTVKYDTQEKTNSILNDISAKVRVYWTDARGNSDHYEKTIGRLS